jgi:hypothetical protein
MPLERTPRWPQGISLDTLNARSARALMASLGVQFIGIGGGFLRAAPDA